MAVRGGCGVLDRQGNGRKGGTRKKEGRKQGRAVLTTVLTILHHTARLLHRQRCVVIVEGFYEWKTDHLKEKQPYYVTLKQGGTVPPSAVVKDEDGSKNLPPPSSLGSPPPSALLLAGLYDCWVGESGDKVYTTTLLTTSSEHSPISWLHPRLSGFTIACQCSRTLLSAPPLPHSGCTIACQCS